MRRRARIVALAVAIATVSFASATALVVKSDAVRATPRGASEAEPSASRPRAPERRAAGDRLARPEGEPAPLRSRPSGSSRLEEPPRARPLPLEVSVRPGCLTSGQSGVVIVRTVPDAVLSLIVVFPDGDIRGTWAAGQADENGEMRLRFAVTPDVPEGVAKATAAGIDERERRATSTAAFRIEGIGGCTG